MRKNAANQGATVDKARADFDCSGRPAFLDFRCAKNAGLIDTSGTLRLVDESMAYYDDL